MLSRRQSRTACALLLALAALPEVHAGDKPVVVADSFVCGATKVRVERFEPAREGRYPAVIVLEIGPYVPPHRQYAFPPDA